MTYIDAARDAIAVQDAVNLSGVVHSFADAVSAIWDEAHSTGQGTAWVNTHPIVTMFIDKLLDLNGKGWATYLEDAYYKANVQVKAIAARG